MAPDRRASLTARTLGGAKAYVEKTASNGCAISLPVSFELVIRFGGDAPCAAAEPRVADAADTLGRPGALQEETRWEACDALRTVPGTDVDGVETLDVCADRKTQAVLEFRYTAPGGPTAAGWRRSVVDGVEVCTLDDRDPDAPSCTAEWSAGPASGHARAGYELVARVRAIDCSTVTPLVEPLVGTLRRRPDAGEPQRPLLYAPDEPDRPA